MAEPYRPRDSFPRDPDAEPAPGLDPVHPANDPAVERDPAMRGTRSDTTVVQARDNRSSLIFAGVIAALLVVALLFFINWSPTDPQATAPGGPAVTEEPAATTETAPATDTAPPAAETTAPAPAGDAAAPAGEATEPAAPAE